MLEQISIPKDEDNSLNDVNCSSIMISNDTRANNYVENLRSRTLNQVKLKIETDVKNIISEKT